MDIARDADAILVTYAKITGDMIRQLTRCRVDVRWHGVDNVDIPEATKKGIVVTKVPDYCIDEVSDHTMALLLAACARFRSSTLRCTAAREAAQCRAHRLRGAVLGLRRVRPHSTARRAESAGIRDEGHCARPTCRRRCSRTQSRASTFLDAAQDVGLRVHPQPARARDEEPVQQRRVQADEADGVSETPRAAPSSTRRRLQRRWTRNGLRARRST